MRMRQLLIVGLACYLSSSVLWASDFQQVQIKGPKHSDRQYSGVEYGPIESSDTLWSIASRYRQNNDLSIYQVMVAIYALNPGAFEQQNLNLMIDGSVLRLPSEAYIARIDPDEAQRRAEEDEQRWREARGAVGQAVNIKPAKQVASTEDLSAARQALEAQLSNLDRQNRNEFEQLRRQISASIESVQALLDDNERVYGRLDAVNEDIEELRNRIGQEGEIQQQMGQLLALQNELLARSEQQQAKEQQKAWYQHQALKIAAGIIPSLLLLGGLFMWLRRRQSEPASELAAAKKTGTPAVVAEDNQMDDLSDALTEEMSDDFDEPEQDDDDLFGEELLDDVLTDELEESLDAALEDELENFDDLTDEMLVPEDKEERKAQPEPEADEQSTLEQDELDDLFAEDSDDDAIDLSELDDEDQQTAEPETEEDTADDFEQLQEPLEEAEVAEADADASSAEDEKPEISIDELLDEPVSKDTRESEEESDDFVDKLDKSAQLSDELIGELDQEISSKNKQLDELTEDLLGELEQADTMQDELSDELLEELSDEGEEPEEPTDPQDTISDELLEELGEEAAEDASPETDAQDELSDELLEELTTGDSDELPENVTEPADEAGEPEQDAEQDDQQAAAAQSAEHKVAEEAEGALAEEEAADTAETDIKARQDTEDKSDADDEASQQELDAMLEAEFEQNEQNLTDDVSDEFGELEEALEQNKDEPDTDDAVADTEARRSESEPAERRESRVDEELEKELDELPDLGDWLQSHEQGKQDKGPNSDHELLDELESSDFDEMLESMEQDDDQESDLDIETLLNEQLAEPEAPEPLAETEDDFLDIDALLNESVEAEEDDSEEKPLNLDKALDSYAGGDEEEDLVDVDNDNGMGAKLDLARAYLEMEDNESAIELLQQVVEKGDPEQQEEAKAILDKLL
jgi:pilus assembly protein FimV